MCRKDEYLLFESRVTTSNHSNFVFRKSLTEKNASENVICFSRLLHMLTNVGLKYRDKQCGPNRHNKWHLQTRWTHIRPDKKSGIRPTKSRDRSGSKLFVTFMEFLKSADDTVRYSITVFCHVCHFIHKGDFGFEVWSLWSLKPTKNISTFDI